MRTSLLILAMACGSVEPRLDCEQPFKGDLEGYCILGENDGAAAARADVAGCAEAAEVPDVARGPGGCEDPSDEVLLAEQEAYARCYELSYAKALPAIDTSDTGPCEPATTEPAPFP